MRVDLQRLVVFTLVFTIALVVLFRITLLTSMFVSNRGWLALSQATQASPERQPVMANNALSFFQKAKILTSLNRSAYLGEAATNVLQQKLENALVNWRAVDTQPTTLLTYADLRAREQVWDEALLYYRAAHQLESYQSGMSPYYLAGNMCQMTFAQLHALSQQNQLFCERYFHENNNNLIVNSQFEDGNLSGWQSRYFSRESAVNFGVASDMGMPQPAFFIEGLTDEYHGGIFQALTLDSGTVIRYSAKVKILAGDNLRVRLLFLGFSVDGEPRGWVYQTFTDSTDWMYVEQTLQVPGADDSLFRIFPTLVTGIGQVWIDDVQLVVQD